MANRAGGMGRIRIWDVHSHLEAVPGDTAEARIEILVRHMDRLGIERLILSQGFAQYMTHPTPAEVREENDRVMRAVRRFPDRAYGAVFLSPDDVDFSLQEFDRCVRDGPMVSVGELQADVRCSSPRLDPIVERAISMNVPILQHTWLNTLGNQPGRIDSLRRGGAGKASPGGQVYLRPHGWQLGVGRPDNPGYEKCIRRSCRLRSYQRLHRDGGPRTGS